MTDIVKLLREKKFNDEYHDELEFLNKIYDEKLWQLPSGIFTYHVQLDELEANFNIAFDPLISKMDPYRFIKFLQMIGFTTNIRLEFKDMNSSSVVSCITFSW